MSKVKGKRIARDWPCQKCGDCCSIIPLDEDIVNKFRERFQRPVMEEKVILMPTGEKIFSIITEDGRCVFLRKDNLCAIYDNRPQICIDFGHLGGLSECHRVTRSGRVRSPPEVVKTLKRLRKFEAEWDAKHPGLTRRVLGVEYQIDDEN